MKKKNIDFWKLITHTKKVKDHRMKLGMEIAGWLHKREEIRNNCMKKSLAKVFDETVETNRRKKNVDTNNNKKQTKGKNKSRN